MHTRKALILYATVHTDGFGQRQQGGSSTGSGGTAAERAQASVALTNRGHDTRHTRGFANGESTRSN